MCQQTFRKRKQAALLTISKAVFSRAIVHNLQSKTNTYCNCFMPLLWASLLIG